MVGGWATGCKGVIQMLPLFNLLITHNNLYFSPLGCSRIKYDMVYCMEAKNMNTDSDNIKGRRIHHENSF